MGMLAKRVSRDDIINYVSAILTQGYKKKDAYLEFIDPYTKNPNQALAQFERKKEFQDIYVAIVQGDSHQRDIQIKRVQNKYAHLIEATLDRTQELVTEAKNETDVGKKSQVIRLATETIGGLTMINGNPNDKPTPGAGLNKAGAVI